MLFCPHWPASCKAISKLRVPHTRISVYLLAVLWVLLQCRLISPRVARRAPRSVPFAFAFLFPFAAPFSCVVFFFFFFQRHAARVSIVAIFLADGLRWRRRWLI